MEVSNNTYHRKPILGLVTTLAPSYCIKKIQVKIPLITSIKYRV